MDSLIFSINAIAPIIIIVAIGYFLKKIGWMDGNFAKMANKLVFHVFLPSMLFLNIYKIGSIGDIELGYVLYCVVALLAVFLVSLPIVMIVVKKRERRGVLWQSAFRSNYALVGIPLAEALFGEAGAMVASILSAVVVPLINMLAVISLSTFRANGEKTSVRKILSGIAQNPLIRGIFAGLFVLLIRAAFVKFGISFRLSDVKPIFTALEYLGRVSTPLALVCLGAQFEFSAVKELRKEIIFGVLARTVAVPIIGLGTALIFFREQFNGAHFAAFIAVFATPVSISSVPMSQEMDADVTLAGQLVVWTTLVSAFSIFIIAFLLRSVGIF